MLSIDPGLNHVGWALWRREKLEAAGLARVPTGTKREPLMTRVRTVSAALAHEVFSAIDALALPEAPRSPAFPEAAVRDVVVEVPQVYRAARSKGDPNDLIAIALVVSSVTTHFRSAAWLGVRPQEWKGTVNGDVMAERIRAQCSITELGYFVSKVPKSLQHNVLDAIGLGRWWLKNRREKACE